LKIVPRKSRSDKVNHSWRLPPKRLLPQVDIDVELNRHNVSISRLIILAGLIRGNSLLQKKIADSINPVCFWPKSFDQYLFIKILENLHVQKISMKLIITLIIRYYIEIWDRYPTRHEVNGELFTYAQILNFSPTDEQVFRSIELCRYVAIKEGWIK
jgi:hypothetical protein